MGVAKVHVPALRGDSSVGMLGLRMCSLGVGGGAGVRDRSSILYIVVLVNYACTMYRTCECSLA